MVEYVHFYIPHTLAVCEGFRQEHTSISVYTFTPSRIAEAVEE